MEGRLPCDVSEVADVCQSWSAPVSPYRVVPALPLGSHGSADWPRFTTGRRRFSRFSSRGDRRHGRRRWLDDHRPPRTRGAPTVSVRSSGKNKTVLRIGSYETGGGTVARRVAINEAVSSPSGMPPNMPRSARQRDPRTRRPEDGRVKRQRQPRQHAQELAERLRAKPRHPGALAEAGDVAGGRRLAEIAERAEGRSGRGARARRSRMQALTHFSVSRRMRSPTSI